MTRSHSSASARAAIALTIGVLVGTAATDAGAATYPVADTSQLTAALSSAEASSESDRIDLAPGVYTGPFAYNGASSVEIVGASAGSTTIQTASNSGINLDGGPGSRIAQLTAEVTGGTTVYGIYLEAPSATVENVILKRTAGDNVFGLTITGADAVVRGSSAEGAFNRGFEVQAPGAQLTDVRTRIDGSGTAVEVDSNIATATVRRSRLKSGGVGAAATFTGKLTISDSVIDMREGSFGRGLLVGDYNNPAAHASTIDAERLTIVGDGTAAAGAQALAGSGDEADDMEITLLDSIVTGFVIAFDCQESGTTPAATISVSDSATVGDTTSNCVDGLNPPEPPTDPGVSLTRISDRPPRFVDGIGNDFRLRWDSEMRDLGRTTPAAGLTDLGGAPRVVDGDGRDGAAPDLGAFEYQRAPPTLVGASVFPEAVTVGTLAYFSVTGTDSDPLEAASLGFFWNFDDGTQTEGGIIGKAFSTPGVHVATVTVRDPALVQVQTQVALTVNPAPPPGPPAKGAVKDSTAPIITDLSVSRRITSGTARPGLVTRKRAQVRFTISENATLELRFDRRVGKTWKRAKGTVRVKVKKGARGLRFVGAIGKVTRLRPSRYRLVAVATDAAGNRSKARRASFTLRKKKAAKKR
jgi:hypothetical protein